MLVNNFLIQVSFSIKFKPDSINSLSPLGYKDYFKINNHNANNLAVKASVDEINLANNLKTN